MTTQRQERAEGERLKAEALAVLTGRRESLVRRAQRALLNVLLEAGSASADNVRALVELPPGVSPNGFGAAPGPLARAGIIRAAGFAKTSRPTAHAWPVTVWVLSDRAAALRWLSDHPDLPDPGEPDQAPEGRQGALFDSQEIAAPAAGTAGAGE